MKIFPPLSEMLWPPGYSAWQLLRARRTFLLTGAAIIGGLLVWPTLHAVTTPSEAGLTVTGPSCNTLVRRSSAVGATAQPCRTSQMTPGTSVQSGKALPRTALPPRPNQLTAADRAIQPSKQLRTTVWGNNADVPSYAPEQPAVAMSPSQYDRR